VLGAVVDSSALTGAALSWLTSNGFAIAEANGTLTITPAGSEYIHDVYFAAAQEIAERACNDAAFFDWNLPWVPLTMRG
jgi:hypothetical protein